MNFTTYSGMSRRHFVRHMAAGSMALPMANWINSVHAARKEGKASKSHSMILLWMQGGPPTIDIWDLKPGSKNGGEFKPIDTTGSGQITEHLPKLAQQMKHLNIIRSYYSREADHVRGTYLNHTAFPPLPTVIHPAIGSVTAKYLTPDTMEIPGHISLGGPGTSPGFLGMAYAPFRVNAGREPIPNINAPVSPERNAARLNLLGTMEGSMAKANRGETFGDHETIYKKAVNLMSSKMLDAFKIDLEDEKMKERYGSHRFGQNCLLARRLVETGVPFIEVGGPGGWDHHTGVWNALAGAGMNGAPSQLSQLDQGFSALVEDLVARGLWETTTVCWMGDFGRTPKINKDGGRDHWPGCWSVVLGGGGMKGGEVVGKTDPDGMSIIERPIEVSNLFATLYKSLGIEPTTELRSPNGRPLKLTGIFGDGKLINEFF